MTFQCGGPVVLKCIDCLRENRTYNVWLPKCEFCQKRLCENVPRMGNIGICTQCRKQYEKLLRNVRHSVMNALTADCTGVVLSYLCAHTIIQLEPLWGFLARVKTVPNWATQFHAGNSYELISVASGMPGCCCGDTYDGYIHDRDNILIGFDARLYPEKDTDDPCIQHAVRTVRH